MLRCSLVMLIAIAQLLAGAGPTRYLCISRDGNHCCVDGGPSSCHCHESDEADHQHVARTNDGEDDSHRDQQGSHSLESFAAEAGTCTCIHVPLGPARPCSVVRDSRESRACQVMSPLASNLNVALIDNACRQSNSRIVRLQTTLIEDGRLWAISTIVIRC